MPFLTWALVCWVLLYATVRFLDRRSERALSAYLNRRNVSIYPVGISVTTSRFNAHLENIAKRHRTLLYHWFALGVGFGLFGLIASVTVLAGHVLSAFNIAHIANTEFTSVVWRTRSRTEVKPSTRVLLEKPAAMRRMIDWSTDGKRRLKKMRQWRRDRRERQRSKHRGYHMRAQNQHLAATPPDLNTPTNSEHIEHDHEPPPQDVKLSTSVRFPVIRQSGQATPRSELRSNTQRVSSTPNAKKQHQSSQVVDSRVRERTDNRTAPSSLHKSLPNIDNGPMLTPLLPGVTVPAFHAVYLAIAILVAAAVHELGHALAAASYDAQVARVGGFFALVFPGAFVQLEGVERLSHFAQLKVWCAGAWHNFVSAVAALGVLAILPSILTLLFAMRAGALVVSVPVGSPLEGAILPGDIIHRFGPYRVVDGGKAFRKSILDLTHSNYTAGFCVSPTVFHKHAVTPEHCCFGTKSDTLLCFHPVDVPRRKLCIADGIAAGQKSCRSATDCVSSGGRPNCMVAQFPDATRLVDIYVHSARFGKDHRLVYQGDPAALAAAAVVSSYVPRMWALLPEPMVRTLASTDIPTHLQRLLQYFASISLAIALLNLAPVYKLDGEHTALLFIKMVAPDMPPRRMKRLKKLLVRSGTALLLINLVVASQKLGSR